MVKLSIREDEEFMRVKEAFKSWRSQKRSGRIPEPLWCQAVGLVKRYSISSVSRGLCLSWSELKKRCDSKGIGASCNNLGEESFLEVKLDKGFGSGIDELFGSSCVLELRKPDGMVLKIYSNKSTPVDVERLFSTFVESKS